MKIYLGGTGNGSDWRYHLDAMLNIEPTMFDVDIRPDVDYMLYTITPVITQFRVLPKIIKRAKEYSDKVIICLLSQDTCIDTGNIVKFDNDMMEFLIYFADQVNIKYGCKYFTSLSDVANYVNED